MKKKYNILILNFFLILSLISSCNSQIRLNPDSLLKLSFKELPDTIQNIYMNTIKPKLSLNSKGDTVRVYGANDILICIDKEIEKSSYKRENTGPWVNYYVLTFNKTIFALPFNGNSINPPYVYYHKQLYCIATTSWIISKKDVESATYGRFDLSKTIKN